MTVDLSGTYVVTLNQESGFGSYDVMLEPRQTGDMAIILEFKVRDASKENSMENTAKEALAEIKQQNYKTVLKGSRVTDEQIYMHGFAFEGKNVLIQSNH